MHLVGGPLGGQLLDVTGYNAEERTEGGALLMSNHGAYGPGGRSDYEPRPGDPDRWDWAGDTPDPATVAPASVAPYVIPSCCTSCR